MRPALLILLFLAVLLSDNCWRIVGGQRCTSSVFDKAVTHITSAVPHDVGSPAVRVTWSTTIPPECIRSIKVNNETDVLYTTTNVTETETILGGLPCDKRYTIHMAVDGRYGDGHYNSWSRSVSVHVGVPPTPVNVTATPTAGSTNVELSWEWSSSLTQCLRSVWIDCQEDGNHGSIKNFQLNNTGITKANLLNLKRNSTYNISVRAIGMNYQTTTMGILHFVLAPRVATPTYHDPATTKIREESTNYPTEVTEDPTGDQRNSSTDSMVIPEVSQTYPTEVTEDPTNDQYYNSSTDFMVIPQVCTYAGAVIGTSIASAVILLIVVIGEFAIILHLRRSITRKEQLQRSMTSTESLRVSESPTEEYSEGSTEWEEAHIYEVIPV